jgi:plasmid stabilization system protein ParE
MNRFAVFQSPLAEKKLFLILEYLEAEWGPNSKRAFIKKFRSAVSNLRVVPHSFPLVDQKRGIHKCVVTKQTSLYYRILDKEIEIITLMDNRQDQSKLFEEIKKHFAQHDM